jgi:hypothetical protein
MTTTGRDAIYDAALDAVEPFGSADGLAARGDGAVDLML